MANLVLFVPSPTSPSFLYYFPENPRVTHSIPVCCGKFLPTELHISYVVVFVQSLSCPALCDHMNCSTPGFPVLHCLPELAQTYIRWVSDGIQPCHPFASFSSCPQSFPASESFPISRLFASDSQSIGASASASILLFSHLKLICRIARR